jgi:hypothetical protein
VLHFDATSLHHRLRLAFASDPISATRELAQAHGAAGAELVGGGAELGPTAEFEIGIQLNQGEASYAMCPSGLSPECIDFNRSE